MVKNIFKKVYLTTMKAMRKKQDIWGKIKEFQKDPNFMLVARRFIRITTS